MKSPLKALPSTSSSGPRTAIPGFMTDLVLMSLGFIFNFSFFFFVFPFNAVFLGIIGTVCFLRRHTTLRRVFIVNVVYCIFLVFTLDVMLLMHAAIYGWLPWLIAVAPFSYAATLFLRSADLEKLGIPAGLLKNRSLGFLLTFPRRLQWDVLQCLIVPLLLTFLLSTKADSPAPSGACSLIREQPGTNLVLDLQSFHGGKIRDMVFIDDPPLVFLTYRKGMLTDIKKDFSAIWAKPGEEPPKTPALEFVEPVTGKATVLEQEGEAIGIVRHPRDSGDVYAVVVNRKPDSRKGVSYTDLLRFTPAGKLKSRIPLPVANSVSYAANLVSFGEDLVIIIEGEFYRYSPETSKIVTASSGNAVAPFAVAHQGRYIYGVNAHSPLFTVFTPHTLVKFDLKKSRVVNRSYGGLFGYYDIRRVPGADRFLASNLWIGGGVLVDTDLNKRGTVPLPRGSRKFLVDPSGRYAYVPNFFTGFLRIVDLRTKQLLPGSWFVGNGTRSIYLSKRDTILIGNSCGIVEADPSVLRSGK